MADLIVMTFDDSYGAQRAMSAVRALTELRYAWVDDVAIVERHRSGRVVTHTPHGSSSGGAWWGALIGMLVGWWWPPVWFLGFAAAGAGLGAAIGKAAKEAGLDEDMIDEVKAELGPGTSALLMIGASGDADEMARAFESYEPTKVIRHEIPHETVESLKTHLEAGEGEAG